MKSDNFSRLKSYIFHYKWWFIGGIAALIIFNATSLAIPWILKLTIERLKSEAIQKDISVYVALIIAFALIGTVFRIISRLLLFGASRYIEFDIRRDFFRHLLKLSSSFYQKVKVGDIISRASNDLNTIRMFIGFGSLTIIGTGFTYIFALAAMMSLSAKLTLLALIPYPIIFIVVKKVTPRMFSISRAVQDDLGDISSKAQENLSGMQVIKAYVQEENENRIFHNLNARYFRSKMRLVKAMGALFPLMGTLGGIGTLIILWQGGRMVISEQITLGDFVAFNGYLAILIWPSIALGWIFTLIQRGMASFERVCEILDEIPSIADSPNPVILKDIKGDITIKNLNFFYSSTDGDGKERSIEALRDINLSIKPGETVAFVGPTGSGKSTLARLLLRFLELDEGKIFLDNVDLTKIQLQSLRKNIGYVPQEGFLFRNTIRENIAFASDSCDEDEIINAASTACLTKDIETFPNKFETLIGERGVTLSAGQRQRLSLARTIVDAPQILILDDALSNVDAHTERDILENLIELVESRTSIIITHRISTIKNANKIFVFDEGEIKEVGKHAELIDKGGIYATLYEKQILEEELEEL